MSGTQNLIQRNGTWYYNRRVPTHLVALVGKNLVRVSLGTGDKGEAKKRRAVKDVEWDARFEELEQTDASSSALQPTPGAAGFVQAYVDRKTAEMEMRFAIDPPSDREAINERIIEADQTVCILCDPANPELGSWITRVGNDILNEAHAPKPAQGDDYSKFASTVVRGLVELTRREMALYRGDRSRTHFDHLFDPVRPQPVPFRDVANQFLAQRAEEAQVNRHNQKWADKVNAVVSTVCDLVGDGTPVSDIDYDACQRMRSLIAKLPTNRTKVYPKLPALKAIERAAADGRSTLAAHTQGDYVATFKAIMELAAAKKLIGHNPAASLRPLTQQTLAPHEKRHPFTLDQISTFLSSDFYRSCAPSAATPYEQKDRAWRFWLPLICLFMGMRPNEVCQLTVADIRTTKDGIWYIDVNESDGEVTKTLKTATSRRRVPVHNELVRIGFLDFVANRHKALDSPYLLPGIKENSYGNRASYALRRFNETFLPAAITLGKRQSFYSFRHSFRDALRRVDAPPSALKALGGWSQGNLVSDNYGDQFDLDLQVKWIELVAYPGLDLSFLHTSSGAHALS